MTEILKVGRLMDLSGKVVLVTGSGYGIGMGIALRFAEAGAAVAVHYNSHAQGAQQVAEEIQPAGGQARVVQADLMQSAGVQQVMQAVLSRFGRLDVLVNNAGRYPLSSILEMSEAEWDEVVDSNLKSVFLCTQAAARAMQAGGQGGAIVNIASVEGSFPAWNHSHYNAAKAGVLMHTQSAARELGQYGIRVNAVSPGLIDRPGLAEAWPSGVQAWLKAAPLGRLGHFDDVADACLFLASPAARWISGINLVVDGGASTRPVF
jgi:NAD(P)-dependent dehydrogenase (short-subunit alcohol dehydrogenase family)